MSPEVLTRCLNCLRLTRSRNGQCVMPDCSQTGALLIERQARFLMTCHGYRVNLGAIWLVENDDPDNFQETRIGSWTGGWADAFRVLTHHRMPTTPNIVCGECHENEVEFLGDDCYDCAREANKWERAEL